MIMEIRKRLRSGIRNKKGSKKQVKRANGEKKVKSKAMLRELKKTP